jgi:hypothetical protein
MSLQCTFWIRRASLYTYSEAERERERERENGVVVRDGTLGGDQGNYLSCFAGSQAVLAFPPGSGNAYNQN